MFSKYSDFFYSAFLEFNFIFCCVISLSERVSISSSAYLLFLRLKNLPGVSQSLEKSMAVKSIRLMIIEFDIE